MVHIQSISCYPEVQGGAPVFAGTRVRLETFVDYMRIGFSVQEFLREFPSITIDQAREAKVLFDAKLSLDQVRKIVTSPEERFANDGMRRGLQR